MTGATDPPVIDIDGFLASQGQALVAAFNGPPDEEWSPLAVMACGFASFDHAAKQIAMRDAHHGWASSWHRLGRRRPTSALVLLDGMTHAPELWGRASYRGYRPAFADFVAAHGLTCEIPPDLDVDHLFARSRMRTVTDGVVRLVLTERRANRGWGSWLERLEVGWQASKPRHSVRAVQLAKALGLDPPTGTIEAPDLMRLEEKLAAAGARLAPGELAGNFEMARRRARGEAASVHIVSIDEA